jgi:hypothetical protein
MDKELLVMKVWRVPPMGKLEVEVNGRRIQTLEQAGHPAVQQRLQTAIGELISFAGGYQELVNQGFAPSLKLSSDAATTQPSSRVEAEFLKSLENQFDDEQGKRPNAGRTKEASVPAPSAPNEAETPLMSLADEIDAILQKHVRAHPRMAGRSIHLHPAPTGGLQIEVDGIYYKRPGEIPDKTVQLLIKNALLEWESR